MVNLLAIDTATDTFSVALASGADTWLFEANAGLRHSELLMDSIDMLCKTTALQPKDMSGVLCMGGPGSFTGLRIGFSAAKGLALSLGIPFAAIPTLDCMAWPLRSLPAIIVPVLDAKKQAFFCALYRDGKRLCPDMDFEPEEIMNNIQLTMKGESTAPVILVGPGAAMLYETLAPDTPVSLGKGLRWGNAEALLHIAQETRIFAHNLVDYSAGPHYIRKSDAEIQRG